MPDKLSEMRTEELRAIIDAPLPEDATKWSAIVRKMKAAAESLRRLEATTDALRKLQVEYAELDNRLDAAASPKVNGCGCGSLYPIRIVQLLDDKWTVYCKACKKNGPACATIPEACEAWNKMQENPAPRTEQKR